MNKQYQKSTIEVNLSHLALVNEKHMEVALREWFAFTREQINKDLTTKFIKAIGRVTTSLTDWDQIEEEGVKILRPVSLDIMKTGGDAAYKHLALKGSFDVINIRAITAVNKYASKLVKEVTNETKKGINLFIKEGVKQGHSMSKIATNLKPLVGLTEKQTKAVMNFRIKLVDKFPNMSAKQLDKKVMTYTAKTHRMRMFNIATTETARVQNIGYVQGLDEIGVNEVEFSISAADFCAECEALNGQKFELKEAEGIIPVHPRCRCAMLPVLNDKTIRNILTKPPTGVGE